MTECAVLRAQTLFLLARPQEALALLQEVAEQDRHSMEYRIVLADTLAASGDAPGAHLEYANVLRDFSLPDELRRRIEEKLDGLSPQ